MQEEQIRNKKKGKNKGGEMAVRRLDKGHLRTFVTLMVGYRRKSRRSKRQNPE